jgi:hypothetical protein
MTGNRRWIPACARMTGKCAVIPAPSRHSCVGRNPSPYLHPAVRAIRWIPACARMTGKCAVIPAPSRHSCAEPALDLIGGGIHPRFLPNSAHSSNDLRP